MKRSSIYKYACIPAVALYMLGCNDNSHSGKEPDSASTDQTIQATIKNLLQHTDTITNKLDDSTRLYALPVLNYYYAGKSYSPLWSKDGQWLPGAGSLLAYLDTCEHDGLFRDDYQLTILKYYRNPPPGDSLKARGISHWAKADILFTDAFVRLTQDLNQGRLQSDRLSWKYRPEKHAGFFSKCLNQVASENSVVQIIGQLQPSIKDYQALKNSLPAFLKTMDNTQYTYLQFPARDSIAFLKKLLQRLKESGVPAASVSNYDSLKLHAMLVKFQKDHRLKPTGKVNVALVNYLNNTDKEKFKRIAITLDKYKQLPAQMPGKYIWVNLPSYYLQVWDNDSLVMRSKIIIGKPTTPTPDISSEITNLVIYPTWTVPSSIISKEILPGLKKNTNYLARKGLQLYDAKGDLVNAHSVNWARFTKGIPYFVRQSSGDNNALGVIKFNFNNPYAVYLHDTNQRYLFKNKSRSLSHGCVRVEDWKSLANYIIRNDSAQAANSGSNTLSADSIASWIAQKQKHTVPVKQRLPLFIRYLCCEAVNGNIIFHEDVYNKDKVLREKYFALK